MGIDGLYNKTFTLYNPTYTQDHGSQVRTMGSGSSVKGRIRKLSGNEVLEYGKKQEKSTHMWYCDVSENVSATSIIKDENDNYYNVVDVDNPHELDEFYQVTLVYMPEGVE